jgi:hypothetical protein
MHKFAAASENELIVFGAARPGYRDAEIARWIEFIFLRGFGGAIRPTPYLYPGRRWDTWTSPVKFTGLDVPKLNI